MSVPPVLVISDGKAGHDAITTGIAEALGLPYAIWHRPAGPWYARPVPDHAPRIALAAGRRASAALARLKARAAGATFAVACLDPRRRRARYDLVWAPAHDGLRAPNAIATLLSPHRFSAPALAVLRATMPPAIAALPVPRVAVLLGGPGGGYRIGEAAVARLEQALRGYGGRGASLLIAASRRTPAALLARVDAATADLPRILWAGGAANPYAQFLAHGDRFIVTCDSVNMVGEACATGRPIEVLMWDGGRAKFAAFHAAVAATGATRALHAEPRAGETWHYAPMHAATEIAAAIRARSGLAAADALSLGTRPPREVEPAASDAS